MGKKIARTLNEDNAEDEHRARTAATAPTPPAQRREERSRGRRDQRKVIAEVGEGGSAKATVTKELYPKKPKHNNKIRS
jgi:hypothetical protein